MRKKTCDRCRALKHKGSGIYECELGYPIIDGRFTYKDAAIYAPVPGEPCPKPLTYLALIDAKSEEA